MYSTCLTSPRVFESADRLNSTAFAHFVYSDDLTLRCIGAKGDPRRWNRADCVGLSLYALEPQIYQPRIFAALQAVETGQPATYYYSHYWRGRTWRFRSEVRHFPEFGEVLCEIFDDADWQTEWWATLDAS